MVIKLLHISIKRVLTNCLFIVIIILSIEIWIKPQNLTKNSRFSKFLYKDFEKILEWVLIFVKCGVKIKHENSKLIKLKGSDFIWQQNQQN